jgi:hypothetical protein
LGPDDQRLSGQHAGRPGVLLLGHGPGAGADQQPDEAD